MITQLCPSIPVVTPYGKGLAHFLIDEGAESHLKWVVFLDNNGECWTFQNPEIRAQKNITHGREHISPFYDPDDVKFSIPPNEGHDDPGFIRCDKCQCIRYKENDYKCPDCDKDYKCEKSAFDELHHCQEKDLTCFRFRGESSLKLELANGERIHVEFCPFCGKRE